MTNLEGSEDDVARLVKIAHALLNKGGTLESTGDSAPIGEERLAAALERYIEQQIDSAAAPDKAPAAGTVAAEVLANAKSAIQKGAGGAALTRLTDLEFASLETIAEVTGRPALRYKDGQVGMPQ